MVYADQVTTRPLSHAACNSEGLGSMAQGLRQFRNNHFTKLCGGSEAGSYLRLKDSGINQLKTQGPCRTCKESKEEEEEGVCVDQVITCPMSHVACNP